MKGGPAHRVTVLSAFRWGLIAYSLLVIAVATFVAWDWHTHDPFDPTFSGVWLILITPHGWAAAEAIAPELTGPPFILGVAAATLMINCLAYLIAFTFGSRRLPRAR